MANSVTARFNDDCKVFVSMSDDTTVEKAVIIDAEGNETDIGGGGGSSDFSTAEVKVINTKSDLVSVLAVSIRDTPSSAIVPFGTIMADSDRTYTTPLYKGVCTWKITAADAVVSVTGDISYNDGNIFITGDGTITIA